MERLSPRQRDIFALVCHDRGYKGTADALGITHHTVKNCLATTFAACFRLGQASPSPGPDVPAGRAARV